MLGQSLAGLPPAEAVRVGPVLELGAAPDGVGDADVRVGLSPDRGVVLGEPYPRRRRKVDQTPDLDQLFLLFPSKRGRNNYVSDPDECV